MVVAFTPNLGLAKPDDTELALEWARASKLSEDNNIIIRDSSDIVLTSYTPVWVGPTTNPNVGAGFITGEYCRMNDIVWGSFTIRCIDPGVSSGSGAGSYGVSLPFLADTTFHTVATALTDSPGTASCVGEGYMTDTSSIPNSGTVALELLHFGGFGFVRPITEAYAGKTVRWFGPTFPFTLATTDGFTGNFCYKAA